MRQSVHVLVPADQVWNRACSEVGTPTSLTAPGDRALADMLLAHGLAMNGGVLHAVQALTVDELAAAMEGYRYFGLDEAANVMRDIANRWSPSLDLLTEERVAVEADERYAAVVVSDDTLVRAFEARYGVEPTAFAPIA